MRKLPNPAVGTNFLDAFKTMVGRIEGSIKASGNGKLALPVRMYVAGGVAAHFYTAQRMTDVVDATFSHRMLLPENLEISYRDTDGKARLLYFDRQYNDAFGLLHEHAYKNSMPLKLGGINPFDVGDGCPAAHVDGEGGSVESQINTFGREVIDEISQCFGR